jgi:hypothetical protein
MATAVIKTTSTITLTLTPEEAVFIRELTRSPLNSSGLEKPIAERSTMQDIFIALNRAIHALPKELIDTAPN